MGPSQLSNDRQPEARSGSGPGGIAAVEAVERQVGAARREAGSVVRDGKGDRGTGHAGSALDAPCLEPNGASGPTDANGVVDEVAEDPVQGDPIRGQGKRWIVLGSRRIRSQ